MLVKQVETPGEEDAEADVQLAWSSRVHRTYAATIHPTTDGGMPNREKL